jgi:selenocysteine lyase/cysteine desulfurase
MNAIRQYESDLLEYGISLLSGNPNVILYGDTEYLEDRIPIISFNLRGKTYEETAEYLYDDYAIITKNGMFGADLYVQKLTQGTPYDGLVRVSMAFFNQRFELDRLAAALNRC